MRAVSEEFAGLKKNVKGKNETPNFNVNPKSVGTGKIWRNDFGAKKQTMKKGEKKQTMKKGEARGV